MENLFNELKKWSEEVKAKPVSKWNELPDIELYMDQVITYIEKQLQIYQEQEESLLITSSMINNYVKDGVIKHAVSKKYSKEHIATLIMIGLLKQVLPLSQISKLTGIFNEAENKATIYDTFLKIQDTAIDDVLNNLKIEDEDNSDPSNGEQKLFMMAIGLSCRAVAYRITAERIFKMLKVNNQLVEKKKKPTNKIKARKARKKASKQEIL